MQVGDVIISETKKDLRTGGITNTTKTITQEDIDYNNQMLADEEAKEAERIANLPETKIMSAFLAPVLLTRFLRSTTPIMLEFITNLSELLISPPTTLTLKSPASDNIPRYNSFT